jgi:hypothetical protein
MATISDKNKKLFLREYKKLVKKYSIRIESCGCCESPWLVDEEEWTSKMCESTLQEHIKHLKDG